MRFLGLAAALMLAASSATAADDCAKLIRKRNHAYDRVLDLSVDYPITIGKLEDCLAGRGGRLLDCRFKALMGLCAIDGSDSCTMVGQVWGRYEQAYDDARGCAQ